MKAEGDHQDIPQDIHHIVEVQILQDTHQGVRRIAAAEEIGLCHPAVPRLTEVLHDAATGAHHDHDPSHHTTLAAECRRYDT